MNPNFTRGYDDPAYKGCQEEARHTPHPIGYLAHHAWMSKMGKTHKQIQCPICGRYAIWVKKPTPEREAAHRDPL